MRRIHTEVVDLAENIGCDVEWDDEGGNWVLIKDFPLPAGASRPSTHVLLILPSDYGQGVSPPRIYLDKGLNLSRQHYIEEPSPDNPLAHRGWAWLCILFESWNPSSHPATGDPLLTAIEALRTELPRLLRGQ